VTSPRMRTYWE